MAGAFLVGLMLLEGQHRVQTSCGSDTMRNWGRGCAPWPAPAGMENRRGNFFVMAGRPMTTCTGCGGYRPGHDITRYTHSLGGGGVRITVGKGGSGKSTVIGHLLAHWAEDGIPAAALDVDPDEARALLRDWAEGQHRLYRGDVANGRLRPFGLDDEAHAAVLALCELGDDEAAAVPAGAA